MHLSEPINTKFHFLSFNGTRSLHMSSLTVFDFNTLSNTAYMQALLFILSSQVFDEHGPYIKPSTDHFQITLLITYS